jgi:hypothetical protein
MDIVSTQVKQITDEECGMVANFNHESKYVEFIRANGEVIVILGMGVTLDDLRGYIFERIPNLSEEERTFIEKVWSERTGW